jgi:hypothetical protein
VPLASDIGWLLVGSVRFPATFPCLVRQRLRGVHGHP